MTNGLMQKSVYFKSIWYGGNQTLLSFCSAYGTGHRSEWQCRVMRLKNIKQGSNNVKDRINGVDQTTRQVGGTRF